MSKTLNSIANIHEAYVVARKRLLLLDYDGTLVPFVSRPELAKPSTRLLTILQKLVTDSCNTVMIISGRDKDALDRWLGHLPLQFIAEHGAFEKRGGSWLTTTNPSSAWKEQVRPLLGSRLEGLLGTQLEEKETSLVFHYRSAVDTEKGRKVANDLQQELEPIAAKLGLTMTHDNLTIEIRPSDTNKGQAVLASLTERNYDFVLCAGDSQTDEDMFIELKDRAFCVKVGSGQTAAKYRIKNPGDFVDFLASLLEVEA